MASLITRQRESSSSTMSNNDGSYFLSRTFPSSRRLVSLADGLWNHENKLFVAGLGEFIVHHLSTLSSLDQNPITLTCSFCQLWD